MSAIKQLGKTARRQIRALERRADGSVVLGQKPFPWTRYDDIDIPAGHKYIFVHSAQERVDGSFTSTARKFHGRTYGKAIEAASRIISNGSHS